MRLEDDLRASPNNNNIPMGVIRNFSVQKRFNYIPEHQYSSPPFPEYSDAQIEPAYSSEQRTRRRVAPEFTPLKSYKLVHGKDWNIHNRDQDFSEEVQPARERAKNAVKNVFAKNPLIGKDFNLFNDHDNYIYEMLPADK